MDGSTFTLFDKKQSLFRWTFTMNLYVMDNKNTESIFTQSFEGKLLDNVYMTEFFINKL